MDANQTGFNCSNLTDYTVTEQPIDTTIKVTVSMLSFVFGVTGNLTLIYLILRTERRLSNPSIFIMNMAIGDMIFLIIYVPSELSLLFSSQWNGGTPTCKLVYFVRFLTLGVSIFTLMALSTDRYFAIARPLKQTSNRCRVLFVIGSVWFISASFAAPATFGARQRVHIIPKPNTTECIVVRVCDVHVPGLPHFTDGLLWFKLFTYFLLPLVIIASFYGAMTVVLCRSSIFFEGSGWGSQSSTANGGSILSTAMVNQQQVCSQRRAANRKKLARTVLCLVAMFIICWLPINVHSIHYFVIKDINMPFKTVAVQLTFVYSCVNPITLFVLSKRFRRAFCVYCCCRRSRNGQMTGHTNSWADNYSRRVQPPASRLRADWRYAQAPSVAHTEAITMHHRERVSDD